MTLFIIFQSEASWPETERWLEQRYAEVRPGYEQRERFRILGYQWRALRFNEDTRQSAVKVMAAYKESEPSSICLMQQPHCLAVPCKLLLFLIMFIRLSILKLVLELPSLLSHIRQRLDEYGNGIYFIPQMLSKV